MTLVVVCGVPGVGKTAVARYVAGQLDADRLRTDVVRKELVDEPAYTEAEGRMVYDELLDRAGDALARGETVVLDGTFHARRYRADARAVAASAEADRVFVKVECDPAVARERIREREGDASDADVAVHATVREQFEPLAVDHVVVDNSGALDATRQQVDERVLREVRGAQDAG